MWPITLFVWLTRKGAQMFRSFAEAAKRRREVKEKERERNEERERFERAERDLLIRLGRDVIALRQRGVRLHRALDDTLAEYERLLRKRRTSEGSGERPGAPPRPRQHWAFDEQEVLRRLEDARRDDSYTPKAES